VAAGKVLEWAAVQAGKALAAAPVVAVEVVLVVVVAASEQASLV